MARRSLKPQLNQIRSWVREGRTNAWIGPQLDVSARDIDVFKRENGLAPEGADGDSEPLPDPDDVDLRAEDDALVAAALDAEPEEDDDEGAGEGEPKPRRRRGRRGGRGRGSRPPRVLEGTFDHGDEGYGLWLDPAVQDNAVYAEYWAGHRPLTVTVEPDRIVLERAGADSANGAG